MVKKKETADLLPVTKNPSIQVRIDPDVDSNGWIWNVIASDGIKSSGLAKLPPEAMRSAAAFVEAVIQSRREGRGKEPKPLAIERLYPSLGAALPKNPSNLMYSTLE